MCEKLRYNGRRIDPCLIGIINQINANPQFRTILSCCGHGKYPKTVIVFNKKTNDVFEWFSHLLLSKGIRQPKRYYKRDSKGYFFIPEICN